MGDVIDFHSAASFRPKRAGSASFSARASACENVKKFSAGIAPLLRQLLTADMPTPAKDAAAAVPPMASMTSSAVLSMAPEYSRDVNLSTGHGLAVDYPVRVGFHAAMPETKKTIAARLVVTREALGYKAAEVCKRIKCAANRWSQYESGERQITLPVAIRLCDEYGLTLDWIYRADPARLPQELRLKMPRTAA